MSYRTIFSCSCGKKTLWMQHFLKCLSCISPISRRMYCYKVRVCILKLHFNSRNFVGVMGLRLFSAVHCGRICVHYLGMRGMWASSLKGSFICTAFFCCQPSIFGVLYFRFLHSLVFTSFYYWCFIFQVFTQFGYCQPLLFCIVYFRFLHSLVVTSLYYWCYCIFVWYLYNW